MPPTGVFDGGDQPGRPLKVFLTRWDDGHALSIARDDQGKFHLVRDDTSIAVDDSLDGVLSKTAPWLSPSADVGADWYVASSPLAGPVYDLTNGDRRTTSGTGPEGKERRYRRPVPPVSDSA